MKEFEYKSKIKEIVLSDMDILKSLANKVPGDDFTITEPSSMKIRMLKDKNIFEYNKVPDLSTENEAYITMAFSFDYSRSPKLPVVTITFFIYVHNNLIKNGDNINRLDFIKERIFTLLNGNQSFEASELRIIGSNDKPPITTNYAVTSISFTSMSISE